MSGSSDTEHKSSSDEVVLLPLSSSDIEIVLEKECEQKTDEKLETISAEQKIAPYGAEVV